jgi:hypothetical protein
MTIYRCLPPCGLLALLIGTAAAIAQPPVNNWGGTQNSRINPQESWHRWNQSQKGQTTPFGPSIPSPTFDSPFTQPTEPLTLLEAAHSRGDKEFALPERWQQLLPALSSSTSKRGLFTTFETLHLPADPDVVMFVLTRDAPVLRRLNIRERYCGEWATTEAKLSAWGKSDPAADRWLSKRFRRLREVTLQLRDCPLSQPEVDQSLPALRRTKRLTGLTLTCGRACRWKLDDPPAPPPTTDLRGLANLKELRSLTLTVPALGRMSLGFPGGLESLTVRETDPSADSLAHLRLPPLLRILVVESDNPATRDRFAALARAASVTCELKSAPPAQSTNPQGTINLTGRYFSGRWKRVVSGPPVCIADAGGETAKGAKWHKNTAGDPSGTIEMSGSGFRRCDGRALVPGYQIDRGEFVNTSWPNPVLQVGGARFSAVPTPEGASFTLLRADTPSGINPHGTSGRKGSDKGEPDDLFRKAAEKALAGTWRRVEPAPGPQPTVIGDIDSHSPDDAGRFDATNSDDRGSATEARVDPEPDPLVGMLILVIASNLFLLLIPGALVLCFAAKKQEGLTVGYADALAASGHHKAAGGQSRHRLDSKKEKRMAIGGFLHLVAFSCI